MTITQSTQRTKEARSSACLSLMTSPSSTSHVYVDAPRRFCAAPLVNRAEGVRCTSYIITGQFRPNREGDSTIMFEPSSQTFNRTTPSHHPQTLQLYSQDGACSRHRPLARYQPNAAILSPSQPGQRETVQRGASFDTTTSIRTEPKGRLDRQPRLAFLFATQCRPHDPAHVAGRAQEGVCRSHLAAFPLSSYHGLRQRPLHPGDQQPYWISLRQPQRRGRSTKLGGSAQRIQL